MARSHAIWLLLDGKNEPYNNEPVAAFTVKREMMTYLDRNRWEWDQLRLFRMADGAPHGPNAYRKTETVEELDIREVMR